MTPSTLPTKEQHAKDYLDTVRKMVLASFGPDQPPPREQQAAQAAVEQLTADGNCQEAIDAAALIDTGLSGG